MTIKWNKLSGLNNQDNFKDFVYSVLKALEANPANWLKPVAMSGTSGITIGIGYDLKKGAPALLIAVLEAMGLQTYVLTKTEPLSVSEQLEKDYINQLLAKMKFKNVSALNEIMKKRATDQNLINAMAAEGKNYTLRDKFRFESLPEVKYAFDNGGYEAYRVQADGFVGSSVTSQDNYLLSRERAALIVVNWLSPRLALDVASSMKAGNRAEAWFKIRYTWTEGTGENYQYNNGWAKRHYFEAQMFGLYDNPDTVTPTEANQIFKMLQKNRLEIARREALYGIAFDGTSGTSLDNFGRTPLEAARQDYSGLLSYVEKETIQDLLSALQPAKEELLANLRAFHPEIADKLSNDSFLATNIYLNPHKPTDTDRSSTLNSFPYQLLYEPNGTNDLMIGMDQTDYLYGNKGNDVLIGDRGNDWLWGGEGTDVLDGDEGNDVFFGGQGNDTMYGGEDNDVYFIAYGDGNDTIEDKEGNNNKIFLCGEIINFFYDTGTGQYKSLDGSLTGVMVGTDYVVTHSNGTQVILNEDFQWGDFGTTLITLPANPGIENTILGDLTPVDFDPNTGRHRTNIRQIHGT